MSYSKARAWHCSVSIAKQKSVTHNLSKLPLPLKPLHFQAALGHMVASDTERKGHKRKLADTLTPPPAAQSVGEKETLPAQVMLPGVLGSQPEPAQAVSMSEQWGSPVPPLFVMSSAPCGPSHPAVSCIVQLQLGSGSSLQQQYNGQCFEARPHI